MNSEPEINSQAYWDKRFEGSWQERKGGEQTRFFAEILMERLPDWFRHDFVQNRMSLCDWGCAEGEAVAYLSEVFPGNEFAGVDFAETAIKNAAEKYPNLKFIAENWIGQKNIEPQYDVVFTSNTLEHFKQPLGILRDVLGRKASKYIVVLIPYAENPGALDPEHFFRFIKKNIPLAWGDWLGVYFEVADTSKIKSTRWQGQQALIIYARKEWIEKTGLELTAANYPAEIPALESRLDEMSRELVKARSDAELAKTKLETQLVHDKVLLESSNRLQEHADKLREEQRKNLAEIQRLQAAGAKSSSNEESLRKIKEAYDKLTQVTNLKQEQQEMLVQQWRETLERKDKESEALLKQLHDLQTEVSQVRRERDELAQRHQICRYPMEKDQLLSERLQLRAEIERLTGEKEECEKQAAREKELLEGNCKGLIEENEILKARLEELERAQGELTRERHELQTKLDESARENAQLKEGAVQARTLDANCKELLQKNERLRMNLRALEDSNNKIQAQVAADAERNKRIVRDQQDQNKQLNEKVLRLQSQILDIGNENARLRKDSALLKQIQGMYYYRLARKLDAVKYMLGLGRRQNSPAAEAPSESQPTPPDTAPREERMTEDPLFVQTMEEEFVEQTIKETAPPKATKDFVVGSILDTFTEACFAPECNLIPFRPDNWKSVLEEIGIDFLFVESAWNGNKGAWQYRVGSYAGCPGRELDDVIKWCWMRGIPTVFWNKEDPPHFEKFIEAAGKFDCVFTTDANCIPRYAERLGHDRIRALPFAAQPAIHNPLLARPRNGNVCFAGTYYADDFEQRRHDMDVLLRGSKNFGLDIYDRRFGYTGADRERYAFPAEFQPFIRGRLEYQEMLEAYHAYKVFVNVNSVYDSPTMFSRRVFELMACGTPVVSTRSVGIGEFFGDLVPQVGSVEEVTEALERLLKHPDEWWRFSARGIRTVMSKHTYTHRMKSIIDAAGLKAEEPRQVAPVVVVIPGKNPVRLADCIKAQTLAPASVIVVDTEETAPAHAAALKQAGVNEITTATPDSLKRQLRQRLAAIPVAFMDASHYYGPNYLADAVMALSYTGCPISGLSSFFHAASATAASLDESAGEEYFRRERVLGATIIARGDELTDPLFGSILKEKWVQAGAECYARGRFEFLHACPEAAERRLLDQVCL